MSDWTTAQLEIGGDITRDRVGALATLLETAIGRNTGDAPYEEQIKAAAAEGVCLFLEDNEVNYGRFGVEEKLAELGISYDARWNSGVDFPEGGERFRPGMDKATGFETSFGGVVVSEDEARRAIELIDRGSYTLARDILAIALGDDVAELTPLRIVDA